MPPKVQENIKAQKSRLVMHLFSCEGFFLSFVLFVFAVAIAKTHLRDVVVKRHSLLVTHVPIGS